MTNGGKEKAAGLWAQTRALHRQIFKGLKRSDLSGVVELLRECQSIAIDTGNYLERYASEDVKELVHVLEAYCEQVYRISVSSGDAASCPAHEAGKILEDYFKRVSEGIRALHTRTEIVFLPYKMSMWDALESIWRAAVQDGRCDVYVVPIPYCDRNADGSVKEWHYEGGSFPADVVVTDYGKYSIEEHRPDVAYIHNPYDGYNLVTSVAPDYYSPELKKYVRKLVYVPYYYAGPVLSDHQNSLAPLHNMDRIILPGEAAVDAMAVYQPREKLLPLGSPKVDRMFLMDGHGEIPKEWKELARGRKVILYNVGLSPMLQGRYRSIEKMRSVFNVFKERRDVLIWWRPHPLIKATLHAAAPELVAAYGELEKEFLLERIGIYDTGPDSNFAVASTDAFIGDYSSMIYMFGMTGKPIFYLNQRVLAERRGPSHDMMMKDFNVDEDGNLRFISEEYGLMCRLYIETGKIEVIKEKVRDNVIWKEKSCCRDGKFVWSAAEDGQSIIKQEEGTDVRWVYNDFPEGFYPFLSSFVGGCSVFSYLIPMGEWIYLFPGTANMVLKIHRDSGEIRRCCWKLPYAEGQRKGTAFTWPGNYLCAKKHDEYTIAAVTAYDYSVLLIDTKTDQVRIYQCCLSDKDFETYAQTSLMRAWCEGGIVCEDGISCCLNDFLDALAGEREWPENKQRELFAGEINNSDGTCGQKVYDCIMKELKEEDNAAI